MSHNGHAAGASIRSGRGPSTYLPAAVTTLKHNPALIPNEVLEGTFAGRAMLLDDLLKRIRDNTLRQSPQRWCSSLSNSEALDRRLFLSMLGKSPSPRGFGAVHRSRSREFLQLSYQAHEAMRLLQRQRFNGVVRDRQCQTFPIAVESAQDRVHEFAGANPVTALRELDGLSDRGVRRHASHEQELMRSKTEEIDQVRLDTPEVAFDALLQIGVDHRSPAQRSIHELAGPAPVARIEARGPAVEGGIEQLARSELGVNLRRRDA